MNVGQSLQNWMLREGVKVTDAIFVDAVDLAVENEIRRRAEAGEIALPFIVKNRPYNGKPEDIVLAS
jgi:hypothetical protein